MRNWRTTLGSSVNTLGTVLMGYGIVPGLTDVGAAEKMKWLIVSGFVIKAVGECLTGIFAADASTLAAHVNGCPSNKPKEEK